jgi:hypothetical protein
MAFIDELNKTMTEFNDKQSLLEPTTPIKKEWSYDIDFRPWYKTYITIWSNEKSKEEKVYINLFGIMDAKTDFAYLFDIFKPKNLVYASINDYKDFNLYELKWCRDYIFARHKIQPFNKDVDILYMVPLHNNVEIFKHSIPIDCPEKVRVNLIYFIERIQQNKHCFEERKNESKKFNDVETQTPLSLRHFE